MVSNRDTIFALATAPGRAGVAIIRVSGPEAVSVATNLAGELAPPRMMSLRKIHSLGPERELIDRALVVQFEPLASYTNESTVEFHLHGGRATVARLLEELSGEEALRLAEPGEFTRRSLMNGRMDLAQAQGLADLIDAETELQRRQALAIAEGAFSKVVLGWRENILSGLSLLEAVIEFGDEGDTPEQVLTPVRRLITGVMESIEPVIRSAEGSRRLREGFEVALVGAPNVGKSSLLNALAQDECAIVSPIAGITRDILRVSLDIGGIPVSFVDMAGLRKSDDEIEKIGISRALSVAEKADIRIFMQSSDTGSGIESVVRRDGDIDVWSKCDKGEGPGVVQISVLANVGIEKLKSLIHEKLSELASGSGLVAQQRQINNLIRVREELSQALKAQFDEICSEHLRMAVRLLDGIISPIDNEDILDEVFSRFCIGK